MCDEFELEQEFESFEIPEVSFCDVPSSMTDFSTDEVELPNYDRNDLFDTHLEIPTNDSVESLNLNDVKPNGLTGVGFEDLEKIKQELDDELSVSSHDIDYLKDKAEGIERAENCDEISFKGVKICATRHGCTGATNCDYSLGAPIGR